MEPNVLEVQVENIPSVLKERAQWIVWIAEMGEKGHIKKVPRNARPPYLLVKWQLPENRNTFSEAYQTLQTQSMSGLQFILTQDDPFAFIDLDKVVDADTGKVKPWADQIVDYFDSYTELSPSGTGLHILVQGELPKANKRDVIELYDRKRAVTMTGHEHRKRPGGARGIEPRQEQLTRFTSAVEPIDKALARFPLFPLLFAGLRNEYAALAKVEQNDSKEDFQFCLYLIEVGASAEQVENAMYVSGLYRDEKWGEREDYRKRTIENAVRVNMEDKKARPQKEPSGSWKGGDGSKATLPEVEALMTQLGFAEQLRFNAWSKRAYFRDEEVADRHYLEITKALQTASGCRWPKELVWEAMESLSYANQYNPMMDWLEGLKWDGADWLGEFYRQFRIMDEFDQLLWRKTLIAMVARALEPGYKVDSMLILQGYQGIRKSGLIEALCPASEYFLDDCAMTSNKDDLEKLRTPWAVEIPELASMKLRDSEHLKSYLSRKRDPYRAAYARAPETHPRHCVFFGTTNDEEFLQDATGNRRFWVVRLAFERGETMPYEWVIEHREKMFAQVVARYKGGERWWLDPADELRLNERNMEFAEQDAWESTVLTWAARHHRFPTTEVLELALRLELRQWDTKARKRVSDILRSHGFKNQPFSTHGKRWYNPTPETGKEEGEASTQKETIGDEAERFANEYARKKGVRKPKVKA